MPTQEIADRLRQQAYREAKRFNEMSIGIGKWKPENFQEWYDAKEIENKC